MAELPTPSRASDLPSLERLLDDWPDAVFLYDEDRERFLLVNRAAEGLLGYRRDELVVLRPIDLSHPDDAPEIPDVLAQADRDGWVRRPWRLLQKGGATVHTEMTISRRVVDGRVASQGIFRVVGDGLLSGAAVDPGATERLKSIDRTGLGVVTLDREGVVTSWNAGAAEHFRLEAHETVGRRVLDLARNEEDRAHVESLMSAHVERDEWTSRLTIHPPDDEAYEALVTCSAIRSEDGELSGFLMITAPLGSTARASAPRMRRARVQCAACGREVAGTMRRKYCSEKCRQWAYYHRHLDAQRERSRQRHERRREAAEAAGGAEEAADRVDGAGGTRI